MTTLACSHQEVGQPRQVCLHLFSNRAADYCKRFTGVGKDYDLICLACKQQPEQIEANLWAICPSCFAAIEDEGCLEALLGQPQVLERATGLSFAHEAITLAEPFPARILDIQPVEALAQSVWIALTEQGALAQIDLERRSYTWLFQYPQSGSLWSVSPSAPAPEYDNTTCRERPLILQWQIRASALDLEQPVGLSVSADGSLAAVVNTYGQHGVVIDLQTGLETMRLERDSYHSNISAFPVAFFEEDGRLLLVHGTGWNRLDVSDPKTGESLTGRVSPAYVSGKPLPEHYLDYFHCGLTVSPNQEWVVDNGWVWQPTGEVVNWSLRRWMQENVWESEDGPSRRVLCWRDYYWDGPLCWIDGQTLAVWGYGDDDERLLPAVLLFDVVTGTGQRWFAGPLDEPHQGGWVRSSQDETAVYWRPGPPRFLSFDAYLFACSAAQGTAVWDVATGERLLYDASLRPLRYHRGARQFLALLPDGTFRVSRLIGQA